MLKEFDRDGFVTSPFPIKLKMEMLTHIEASMRTLFRKNTIDLDEVTDQTWQKKMNRSFRIFPPFLSQQALSWAKQNFCRAFGKTFCAVNVVLPQEVAENPEITENHLAIYWRYVRPGKPDAGRPHRDANFWDLEFGEGYDPKVPFPFNHLENCMKIWIPLAGCTPETTLRIIPGSHKMEIPTIIEQTEYGRRPSICPEWLTRNQNLFMSPPELSQECCILFDMNLVHVGPRHNQNAARVSAEFNFISK
jgi:ectoine hydroxylase-related dioxygenase (phytanoyl-CoA dioxygenase family)